MYCINCWSSNTKVVDSRTSDEGESIRRRRECEDCQNRFTTFEKVEIMNLIIEKSGNRKERYIRNKLEDSIIKATNKRKLSIQVINDMIKQLEYKWWAKNEITTKEMWKDVLCALIELDEVAYIRYASVHLNFETAKDFTEFISKWK